MHGPRPARPPTTLHTACPHPHPHHFLTHAVWPSLLPRCAAHARRRRVFRYDKPAGITRPPARVSPHHPPHALALRLGRTRVAGAGSDASGPDLALRARLVFVGAASGLLVAGAVFSPPSSPSSATSSSSSLPSSHSAFFGFLGGALFLRRPAATLGAPAAGLAVAAAAADSAVRGSSSPLASAASAPPSSAWLGLGLGLGLGLVLGLGLGLGLGLANPNPNPGRPAAPQGR